MLETIKKTLLITAVGALAAVCGQLAPLVKADKAGKIMNESELLADCPGCNPPPDCYPNGPCC